MITSQVIVSTTTTDTSYTLPQITPCQEYMANVTPSSSEHQGDSVVTVQRSPGGYYVIMDVSHEVTVNYTGSVSIAVTFRLELKLNTVPCLNQSLETQTYPQDDPNNLFNHTEQVIRSVGAVSYVVNSGIERKHHYIGIISVINVNKDSVGSMTVAFSTYDIQHCDVHSDNTSILVECTFAINSTAPGFVLLQDEQGQYNTNRTLQRLDLSGFVNISGLPAGEYSVTVFDQEEDYVDNNPAFELDERFQICYHDHHHIMSIIDNYQHSKMIVPSFTSAISVPTTFPIPTSFMFATKPTSTATPASSGVIITAAATAFFILILLVVSMILAICMKIQKRGKETVEHVPVEDNPAYIIDKKIDLNNNSAYATSVSVQHSTDDYEYIGIV